MKPVASIFGLIVLTLMSTVVHSMNDTDGVCGNGLFPLGPNARNLLLLSERMDVTLTKQGVVVRHTYRVRNTGKKDTTFSFGAIKCANCSSEPKGDHSAIRVDGQDVQYTQHLSFLRDSGTVVTRHDLTLSRAKQLLNSLDGTIETHLWMYFEVPMGSGATKTFEVENTEYLPDSYFTNAVLGNVCLYTEKFWASDSVPIIKVTFKTDHNFVPIRYFIPNPEFYDFCPKPDTMLNNRLIWTLNNYRPNKTMYSYGYGLLVPDAVMRDSISAAFSKATGRLVRG